MKIIHVPFCFYPDAVGGTEIYVEALAREQRKQGFSAVIAAPGQRAEHYPYNEIPVRRFPVARDIGDLREMYGEGDEPAALAFGKMLDDESPDLVHLHAFTRGASLRLVREAKRRGLPVVFSYHTPTASCQRGTLVRWGKEVCKGILNVHGCARCTLQGQGLSKAASFLVGSLPTEIGQRLGKMGVSGAPWTALRMTELVELRHSAFRALAAEVDHIIALCDWVRELLVRNSVPSSKVTVSRQGLCHPRMSIKTGPGRSGPLRIAFLGRLDPTKGVHLLIDALANIPTARIRLDIYGVTQGVSGEEYSRCIVRAASCDARIRFHRPIPAGAVVNHLCRYDLLAVPSQLLETGPMVVLEAFAAGVPVIGSNLGGISELVSDGVNGLLVEASSAASWATAFDRLSRDSSLLENLRLGVRPPRTIKDSADEMLSLYTRLIGAQDWVAR